MKEFIYFLIVMALLSGAVLNYEITANERDGKKTFSIEKKQTGGSINH